MILMTSPDALKAINDFPSLVAYLRDELEWEIPEDLSYDQLTYSYTADELGLKLDAQVEITQLRPILGQQNPWGVFFVDFDKAELPVTLLRRILSSVSRRKRASANAGDRALFDKNDLLFVSAFGKADERRLALAHFHQEPEAAALPTLRVLAWDRHDTQRHMDTVAERLERLRWPGRSELPQAWKSRWSNAFIDRPRAAISTSKDLAAALATCAKQIRQAIQEILPKEGPGQPLSLLFEAVKATLNKDLDAAKFADTYAQTIAYGLLSKRIDQIQRWRAQKKQTLNGELRRPMITVDALEAAIPTNPFLSELLNSFLAAGGRDRASAKLDFDELGLGDVVDLLNTANMEAVLDDFDKDKQGDDPVIHFYEGFLAAYDKAMKVQRGVFYTPKPVVSFIVRSVDEVLRTEFGLPLGLADTTTWGQFVAAHPAANIPEGVKAGDPFVKILDPATGTGTFLVEAIELIHRRMMDEAWKAEPHAAKYDLWNAYVAEHLLPRLYGYELMMAPYAVAHMKIAIKLQDTGYDFASNERVRLYLTNALEPARPVAGELAFMSEALAHEARAANAAKETSKFTVVVGNPPYAESSANNGPWITELMEAYKSTIREQEAQIKTVSNDYVKFLRLSEHLVSDMGLFGLITGNGFLDGILFRDLRTHWMSSLSTISLLNLNGSARRGDGEARDENVFDIMQGVGVWVGEQRGCGACEGVSYASLVGPRTEKFRTLSSSSMGTICGEDLKPQPPMSFFKPFTASTADLKLFGLDEIFSTGNPRADRNRTYAGGFKTRQDSFTIAFSEQELHLRIDQLADPNNSEEKLRREYRLCSTAHFDFAKARGAAQSGKLSNAIGRVAYRPFDHRPCIWAREVLCEPQAAVADHLLHGENLCLSTSRVVKDAAFRHVLVSGGPVEVISLSNSTSTNAYMFPLFRYFSEVGGGFSRHVNLSPRFRGELSEVAGLRWASPDTDASAKSAFSYIYAVLHSELYREAFAQELLSGFPRVPIPTSRAVFEELGALGKHLIDVHLMDPEAVPSLADPNVRFVRNSDSNMLGRWAKEVRRDSAGRVYISDKNWFGTVPEAAWTHWVGGYQPAQKWLKDRCQTGAGSNAKPGPALTADDLLHYRRMIVALGETAKVMTEIDEVIARHGGWPDAFKGMND